MADNIHQTVEYSRCRIYPAPAATTIAPQPAVAASGNLIWVLFRPLTAVTRRPQAGRPQCAAAVPGLWDRDPASVAAPAGWLTQLYSRQPATDVGELE